MEIDDTDFRGNHGLYSRPQGSAPHKIPATFFELPTVAGHTPRLIDPALGSTYSGSQIILIASVLPAHEVNTGFTEGLPYPSESLGVEPHQAAVDALIAGFLKISEIAQGPEILRGVFHTPRYVSADHCVQIKIQEISREVLGIKQLHLVPPGSLGP